MKKRRRPKQNQPTLSLLRGRIDGFAGNKTHRSNVFGGEERTWIIIVLSVAVFVPLVLIVMANATTVRGNKKKKLAKKNKESELQLIDIETSEASASSNSTSEATPSITADVIPTLPTPVFNRRASRFGSTEGSQF